MALLLRARRHAAQVIAHRGAGGQAGGRVDPVQTAHALARQAAVARAAQQCHQHQHQLQRCPGQQHEARQHAAWHQAHQPQHVGGAGRRQAAHAQQQAERVRVAAAPPGPGRHAQAGQQQQPVQQRHRQRRLLARQQRQHRRQQQAGSSQRPRQPAQPRRAVAEGGRHDQEHQHRRQRQQREGGRRVVVPGRQPWPQQPAVEAGEAGRRQPQQQRRQREQRRRRVAHPQSGGQRHHHGQQRQADVGAQAQRHQPLARQPLVLFGQQDRHRDRMRVLDAQQVLGGLGGRGRQRQHRLAPRQRPVGHRQAVARAVRAPAAAGLARVEGGAVQVGERDLEVPVQAGRSRRDAEADPQRAAVAQRVDLLGAGALPARRRQRQHLVGVGAAARVEPELAALAQHLRQAGPFVQRQRRGGGGGDRHQRRAQEPGRQHPQGHAAQQARPGHAAQPEAQPAERWRTPQGPRRRHGSRRWGAVVSP